MEFRLVLRGHLPPHRRGTVDVKQRIRHELHPQIRTLFQQHPAIKGHWEQGQARQYERFGFQFCPLVTEDAGVACALDILILRREEPFKLFNASGDVDGRVKTLLDGLRMPQQAGEIGEDVPSEDEKPFFCLLEDDNLIYELNATTDRLLLPPDTREPLRDVVAIIKVKTKTFHADFYSMFDMGG